MELLAPVGSKEAFVTAIRAGADAVYIGVPAYNARVAASNISLFDLRVLLDHAREKNVRVYLALNTLIKHEEINDVVKNITYAAGLSPDAFIVQDLGVAGIIRKYFPGVPLHASTQMAVHNRMGVDFLAGLGFERVIVARELSFSELKIIANGAPAGIEVFCHGALCFSLSGMCLFSSFIGGLSGNRGRCTQPCRRLWQNGQKNGYLFSPRDLELAKNINKLKNIGIAAVKIEGRMRSSEYVYKTVKAYRMLIDASESDFASALSEAEKILSGDTAREKTTCLFSGRDNDMFRPKEAQCLGNVIGRITDVSNGNITVELDAGADGISAGDRLRLSNPATDDTVAFKVKEFLQEGAKLVIPFGRAGDFARGNPVFKTVDNVFDQKNLEKDIDAIYAGFTSRHPKKERDRIQPSQTYTALISNKWKLSKSAPPLDASAEQLWIRFDDISWLDVLPAARRNTRLVYYLTRDNLHAAERLIYNPVPGMAAELPPFIGQRELPLYQQCLDKMIPAGVSRWVLNNVSQFGLFKGAECELSAGQFLYTWNAYTAALLSDNGIKYFTASWEDDFLNIRKMSGPGLGKFIVVYLYGYPPVARSRLLTKEMLSCEPVREHVLASSRGENRPQLSFTPVFESELALLIPAKPVNIFTGRRKFRESGISNFGIDLCFTRPSRKTWEAVLGSYESGENAAETVKFNFKRGIK